MTRKAKPVTNWAEMATFLYECAILAHRQVMHDPHIAQGYSIDQLERMLREVEGECRKMAALEDGD